MIAAIKMPLMSLKTLSVTKLVHCAIYHRKMDATGHFIYKTQTSVISGFVANLIKDKLVICVVRRYVYLASILP